MMKTVLQTIALLLVMLVSKAQVQNFNLTVNGTSTLHDWEMKTSKIACTATFTFYEDGDLGGVTQLNFTMPAESLKGDRTGMDANAYRSLNTSENPTITYNLTTAKVSTDGKTITCTGKLTVAGVTRSIDMIAIAQLNKDKSITINGSKKINMRDYGIDPPSFMMGTVKTGEEVTISYNLTFRH